MASKTAALVTFAGADAAAGALAAAGFALGYFDGTSV